MYCIDCSYSVMDELADLYCCYRFSEYRGQVVTGCSACEHYSALDSDDYDDE